jgi:two-component system sensor histidine kinase/response regulator
MTSLTHRTPGDGYLSAALAALRNLPDSAVVVFDTELRYVLIASDAIGQPGLDRDTMEGRLIADVLPPERWALLEPLHRAALRGESNSIEVEAPEVSRWYRVHVGPCLDAHGGVTAGLSVIRDITDRKRGQDRVDSLLESAPDAMVVVDEEGVIALVNAQAETLFGYGRTEMLGQRVEMVVPQGVRPGDADRQLRDSASSHAPGIESGSDLVGRRKDGTEFPAEVSLSPLITETQTMMSSAIRDVSERKRLEALAGHLAAVVESSPDAIISKTLDGIIVSWSPGAQRLYGYSEAEIKGQPISTIVPAGHDDKVEKLVQRVVAGERLDDHFATVRRRKDGSLVDVSLAISAVRDGSGRVIGVTTTDHDITEQKRAAVALAQARADIDRFFALSLDLMMIANDAGRFVRVNPAFERLLGYSPQELIGQPFTDFIHPDDLEPTLQRYTEQTEGGKLNNFENQYRHNDGSYRWVLWSATATEDGLIYATGRDVTERREMEEALRATREQALEASRLKSEFVANMSHEIRTPLNGVVCMSELLLETELKRDQREYAEVALTSAEALMRVINDILDFSKIEAGRLDILHEDYSVETTVNEVCEIVGGKAHEKKLELAVSISPEVPPIVRGDSNRVRQVLVNLLGNAVKFTTDGEIVVRVGVERIPHAIDRLRLEVTDTGIGIERDKLAGLFLPFSQGDATMTRKYGGSGLGLSIAKQLVDLMGGELAVESAAGEGSTFWFTLPCEPGTAVDPERLVKDLTGTRVLVVDDNATNREIVEQQAAHWGLIPDSADGARQALELMNRATVAGRPYEIAVIDMHMPGMDGMELAQAIKGNPRLRSTRLIMLSSSPVSASEARAAGIEAELAKPVRQSRLYNQLVASMQREPRRSFPKPEPQPDTDTVEVASSTLRQVLVAEDNEINQFAATQVLRKLGFTVEIAVNGREAIEMTAHKDYIAVFMDCQMPEVDGYAATATIRRREGDHRHTPIIAMTAHTMGGDREKCLAAGMDDYIAKPLRLDTVADVCAQFGPGRVTDAQAPSTSARSLFDPAGLFEIANADQAAKLIWMFIDQTAERLPLLAAAIATPDAEAVHQIAHGLKGSAATLGAPLITDICGAICEIAKHGSTDGASELYSNLADAVADTKSPMLAYLEQTTHV